MSILIDGKSTAQKCNNVLKDSINELVQKGNRHPKLTVIQVGNVPASSLYIRNKMRACERVGILFEHITFEADVTQSELLKTIEQLNHNELVDGILVQLPLPKHINEDEIISAIAPEKDADGFNPITLGHVMLNTSDIFPGTPKGIVRLLEEYQIPIEGANVVVVGRSNIVGKPVASMLTNKSATVTVCHSKTKNLAEITKRADILIVAIGRANFITKDFVNEKTTIIDVGINKVDDKFFGDVDFENVKDIVHAITPVPGGVGPMTISSLLDNVFKLYTKKIEQ
jgi:methylenetetrahydrofolate dehydrogenase (NADP+)/methenyltetrahydrofolate cyclohydrolase